TASSSAGSSDRPSRWQRVNELFHAAISRPPDERTRFLVAQCGGDGDLQRDVESLIAAHERGGASLTARAILTPGARIREYEITGFLASGAMGEVYRARDTRLGREAALKILPPSFVADPDRRARFEREARVLASLTHPHIATIYGFQEDGGVS